MACSVLAGRRLRQGPTLFLCSGTSTLTLTWRTVGESEVAAVEDCEYVDTQWRQRVVIYEIVEVTRTQMRSGRWCSERRKRRSRL